ncbi:MAG: hypothetical protein ACYS8W_15670 [Planctomycetota bacterium]|jgi:hypothetical protein
MSRFSIPILVIIIIVLAAVSMSCSKSSGSKVTHASSSTNTNTGTGSGTGTDTGTGTVPVTSACKLRIFGGPNNPGGKLTWSLPASGTFKPCTFQFILEAKSGNVSVNEMVFQDMGTGSFTNGTAIKATVFEDLGDCAAKYDTGDAPVSGEVTCDDSRYVTLTFSNPIDLIQDMPRTFIFCLVITSPSYSPDPDYYQTKIHLFFTKAVETGTTLEVPAEDLTGGSTDPTGGQVAFQSQ